ncbi:hypothetical protein [Streptomyces sp. NBC_00582]|uniref:hypothetical protein n=1 Tax=Streptomyces sp. NBC_00582 TaxID=2975783 RepID=UPI002E815290|nr:hypothetical protein [Streptomyces sp. NBC_00582]
MPGRGGGQDVADGDGDGDGRGVAAVAATRAPPDLGAGRVDEGLIETGGTRRSGR